MATQATYTTSHCNDASTNGSEETLASDRFLAAIAGYQSVLIVAHDNPDPDAIATGWAIKVLVETLTSKPVELVAGGRITRAENRHMVTCLGAPVNLIDSPRLNAGTAVTLVDCGVMATHHLVNGTSRITAVIDHHTSSGGQDVNFADIRPEVAASASIAASYLQEQGITPASNLATALIYALRTETRGGENHYTQLDRAMLNWLTQFADPEMLSDIDDAPLSRAYYAEILLAIQNTTIFGETAVCILPHAEGPEIVGEVADLLIRCDGITSVLCGVAINADVLLSARTRICEVNATELILETLAGIGSGGGHQRRAGGKIPDVCIGDQIPADVVEELRARWLRATGQQNAVGAGLVAGPAALSI